MPHINRIRVNNVKYNFGTQYYDDFVMRFSGKNTIYDLANGGGKSVLMLLLLQNLIPNCTLDEKQPIEKLFRSGNGNTAIHSLIEWKLNPCHVKNGYQYMTTGFCARKAKGTSEVGDDGKETASVDYFNYCIFYRQFNDNDLKNLPLSNGRERITYLGLRSYLQELEKKDFHVEVKIFDRKGDYQRFISRYGLFESEWEIIRGINKTEGHVRTYFETNYRTTRKVVEDLLIEEIIEKSFYHKTGAGRESGEMANTLLDLKDQLVLLSRKKNEIHYYDRQTGLLGEFAARVGSLQGMYAKKQGLEEQLVKTYHTTLKRREQKEHAHEQLILQGEQLALDKTGTAAAIEAAKICRREQQFAILKQETEQIKKDLAAAEQLWENKNSQLESRECDNYYLNYLENEREYLSAKEAVAQILSGNENLEAELFGMAQELKDFVEKDQAEAAEYLENLNEQLQQAEQKKRQLDQQREQLLISQEVLQLEEKQLQEKKKTLQEEMSEFSAKEGLLLFTDLAGQCRRANKEADEAVLRLRKTETQRQQCEKDSIACAAVLRECTKEEKKAYARLEKAAAERGTFSELQKRMDQLIEIYGGTADSIENILFQRQKELVLEHQNAVEEQKHLQKLSGAYADGIAQAESKAQMACLEEIVRYYDAKAISGYTYLKRQEPDVRESLSAHYPMLPYAVVTSASLYEIENDVKFREKDFGNLLIPIISLEALQQEKSLHDESKMVFIGKAVCRESVSKRLTQLETVFAGQFEKERILKQDYDFVRTFLQLRKEQAAKQEAYDGQKAECKALQTRKEELLAELRNLEERRILLEEQKKELEAQAAQARVKAENLEKVHSLDQQSQDLQAAWKKVQRSLMVTGRERELCERKLRSDGLDIELMYEEKEIFQQRLKRAMKCRDSFQGYLREGAFPKSGLPFAELEAAFLGRKTAYEQKNTDVSDKQKLAASFEHGMKSQREGLQLLGKSIEEMQQKEAERGCVRTEMENMLVLKREAFEAGNQKILLAGRLKEAEEQLHRMEGSIQHAKQMTEETYGMTEIPETAAEHPEQFIEQQQSSLRALEIQQRKQEKELRSLEEQCYALKAMAEDMERMMRAAGIRGTAEGYLETGVSLKEQYEDLRNSYERIVKEEGRRLEEIEKEKHQLTETLEKMGAYELSSEIRKNLDRPENEQRIREQVESLREVIECLELEKGRIAKDMESLQDLKDRFEAQCLQNCLNMKEELDRLPKLSKISMNKQMISMITLQIPYIKEELYADAMSEYIDRIIRQVENYETQAERLNYIRSQLAFKRLFSVIVTNMDAIRLTLYKRERMKEQSRYLRYEEAVGSTGQSQGIYIQFLVAIINYISSINSGNADPLELKKVIFIDNPFGAAKDIYIWEPIFALLKANNVQLIVPARGATPAITGHFEVNYILGQKLIDGRQQTVVTDYRSQTRESELEYETMEFEQATLF